MSQRQLGGGLVMGALVMGALWITSVAARAYAPSGRYVVSGDTVSDTKTQLTWQRTASTTTYTWAAAQTYCTGGWRLPKVRELASLVDIRRSNPAIDPVAFPNTPAEAFWSASPSVYSSNFAWNVVFNYGNTFNNHVNNSFRVRCVR